MFTLTTYTEYLTSIGGYFEAVEIPHTYIGYGAGVVEHANFEYMEDHPDEFIRPLNLVYVSTQYVANTNDYTVEQWEALTELVEGLTNDPCLSTDYMETLERFQLEWTNNLDLPDNVTGRDFLDALYELGLYLEEEPNLDFYLSEEDTATVLEHLKNK